MQYRDIIPLPVSTPHSDAIVVLPPALDGTVSDKRVRQWLARADLEWCEAPQEILTRVVTILGQPACADGLAALRFWGQTGDRPAVWMAAADPVYLEARMEHLRLHCLWPDARRDQELHQLFAELQSTLAAGESVGFVSIASSGYLRGNSPMPTALFSPEIVAGCNPVEYLPSGPAAARYQTLLSEIQMMLHNSVINRDRENQGLCAINSLWIWGGGMAAKVPAREIPPLFADDAVLRGYWLSSDADVESWPASLDRCIAQAPHGFVAMVPEKKASAEERLDALTASLRDLRTLLGNSELRGLTLLFRNGLTARIRPRQLFRIWRRDAPNIAGSRVE